MEACAVQWSRRLVGRHSGFQVDDMHLISRWIAAAEDHHLLILRCGQHNAGAVISMTEIEISWQANVVKSVCSRTQNSRRYRGCISKDIAASEKEISTAHKEDMR